MNIKTYLSATLLIITLCVSVRLQPKKDVPPNFKTVAYCDVVRKHKSYNGKVVRLKAQFYAGSDWSIGDRSCEAGENVAAVNFLCKDEEECREAWRPLETIIPWDNRRDFSLGGAEVIIVGRFHGPRRGGYGHMGMRKYLFEVMRVESASAIITPDGPPNNGMHPTADSAAFIENLSLITVRRGG